MAEGIFLCIVV